MKIGIFWDVTLYGFVYRYQYTKPINQIIGRLIPEDSNLHSK
jgi:hypothetical protein